jgi:Protein of unknown function (DUF2924)
MSGAISFIGLQITRLRGSSLRRDPMRRSRPVVHRATKPTLEGEIAQMRDLDVKGLRLRWQSMFRRQAPWHLPRHLLLAVMAYQLQADQLGNLATDTVHLLKQIASKGTSEAAVRLTSDFGLFGERQGRNPI